MPGIQQGAAALGWKSKVIVYQSANPGAGLQQAVNEKPNYIAITGIPVASIKPQLAAAHAAGIPVMSCGTTDEPSATGYAMECGGTLETDAEYLGHFMINDSKGAAHVLAVSIPQFTSLTTEITWFNANFTKLCPMCSFSTLNVTVDDVGAGAVGSKLVAYLQTHPNINYVLFTFGDLSIGVYPTLKAAGLTSKVKLLGAVENADVIKGISNGTYLATSLSPNPYMGMTMVDGAARLSVGDPLTSQYQTEIYHNPNWLATTPAAAQSLAATGSTWPGPTGYAAAYEKLWHVG